MGTIVALLLTVFVYLIYPLCYRYTNGKVSKKKGNKIALWNSVICCSIFCLLAGLITGGETIVTSFAPAITYYFITKWILIDKTIPDEEENAIDCEDVVICGNCGMQIFDNEKHCPNCGEEIILEAETEDNEDNLFVNDKTFDNTNENSSETEVNKTKEYKQINLTSNNITIQSKIENKNTCPNCNSSLKKNSKFCTHCGLKIEEYTIKQERVYKHNLEKYKTKLNYMANGLISLIVLLVICIMLTLTFLTMDFSQGCPTTLIITSILIAGIITLIIYIKTNFNSLYNYILTCNYNSNEKTYLTKNQNNYQNGTITQEEYINKRKNVLQKITKFKYRILI